VGIDEMLDLMIGFLCVPDFCSKHVSVVGGGGAITVAASDALDPIGLTMPEFPADTQQEIRRHLAPTGNSVKNPVDVGTPVYLPHSLRPVLEAVAASNLIEAVIVEHWVSNYMPVFVQELADVVPSVKEASGKPFIVTLPPPSTSTDTIDIEETRRHYRQWYLDRGIPVFDSLQQAAHILGKIIRYNEFIAKRRR
jgi:acyl-CoA synthetase (NDP forming)